MARDAGYLEGFVRVRDALRENICSLEELRNGRLAVDAIPALRIAIAEGWAEPPLPSPELELGLHHAGALQTAHPIDIDQVLDAGR